jgi:eukaryotic-like serine/threonine-protein kinase
VVADTHPSAAELDAFALGTLDDAAFASVETHVADCRTCQERAAESSDDNLVAVLRRVHVQTARQADTMAQTLTPRPIPADAIQIDDYVPPELARHERYRVIRLLGAGGMGK